MKKLFILLFVTGLLSAQFAPDTTNSVGGGLGMAVIDGNPYFTLNLATELHFGKFGLGLNIPLLYSPKEGIRKEDWNSKRDYARIISYVRYGYKGDPFYIRIGALSHTTLGHGFLVYNYNNRIREDEVKVGAELYVDRGFFGFEGFNSDFGRLGLMGIRGFVRPFKNVPIAGRLQFGGSFVRDFDPDEREATHDGISALGLDAGFPIFQYSLLSSTVYADYGTIVKHGHGFAEGIIFSLNGIGIFDLGVKLEERQLSPHFTPAYFNSMYEVDKPYKEAKLDSITQKVDGTFGELYGEALGKLRVSGNYFHKKNVKNSGVLNILATTGDMFPVFTLNWRYYKDQIETMKDVFTINDRSILFTEIGYRLNPYMTVFTVIKRTYRYDEETGKYKPTDRYGVRVEFNWHF